MAGLSPVPDSVAPLVVRPLDKGLVLNAPSQTIDDAAIIDCSGFLIGQDGLTRRPGWRWYFSGDPFDSELPYDLRDMITAWDNEGFQKALILTEFTKFYTSPGFAPTEVVHAVLGSSGLGSITVSGATFSLSGVHGTSRIAIGDLVRVGSEEAVILTLGATSGTFEAATIANGTYTGANWALVWTAARSRVRFQDSVAVGSVLLMTDGKHPPVKFDIAQALGSEETEWCTSYPAGGVFTAACCAYHRNLIWFGSVEDATDGYVRYRIRWSTWANLHDLSLSTTYLDLPYANGSITRLIPLGQNLVAYFDDAIFIGTPTSYAALPLQFSRVESGGVGLIAPRAVTSIPGGHVFVGQDDVYLLSGDGLQRIGTPIIRNMLRDCRYPEAIQVALDTTHFRVVFGVPGSTEAIAMLWSWDYKANAWSSDPVDATMLASPLIRSSVTYDEANVAYDDAVGTYDGASSDARSAHSLFIGYARAPWILSDTEATDFDATPIGAMVTTKDYDLGMADTVKIVTRFSMKLADINLVIPLIFSVEVSTNRGRTWKTCGLLQIPVNSDEGYVSFRATGSIFRFRIRSTSTISPYLISELGLRIRSSGSELNLGVSR